MLKKNIVQTTTDIELLYLYSELMEELRHRGLTRTNNNPVADYAEKVAVEHLKLTRAGKEERGFDAFDSNGTKYQIKGRRLTRHNGSRQLGVIRNIDEKLFDYLIAVIFNEDFDILEIWKIPYDFVKKHSKWSIQQNGDVFRAKSELLLNGKGVKQII